MRRIGVFSIGQIWALRACDGTMRGFVEFAAALEAAFEHLTSAHPAGEPCELWVQDETGFFGPMPLPTLREGRERR
jgi:hypothetical protein